MLKKKQVNDRSEYCGEQFFNEQKFHLSKNRVDNTIEKRIHIVKKKKQS